MRVVVVNAPDPVVSWEEAQAHLRLDGDAEKAVVEGMIAAATAHIDGPSGWLGRAIGLQDLEARFDLVGIGSRIRLRYPPVAQLLSVTYLDHDDVEQEADIADFDLYDGELSPIAHRWPWDGGSLRRGAGRVTYRAGYDEVPPTVKTAILLMVGELYSNRELAALDDLGAVGPLLQPYRVYF